ncbi:MAG TPA: hypothetical protein VE988_13215 [Gemmataceae bacterium]|nr:hypothetical protein [Gemmataceae bacterium]
MSFTHWLRNLRSVIAPGWGERQHRSRSPRRTPAARFRPQLEFLEDRVTPSTLTVTTALDVFDGGTAANPAGPDKRLSLREAISAAKSGDQIKFAHGLNGSTINLDPGQGELLVNKNLRIKGLGADNLAISGQNLSRVFEIEAGATDTISGLTIENGIVGSAFGGGIHNDGTLTLRSTILSGNYAGSGGGGIYNGNGGKLTVTGGDQSDDSNDNGRQQCDNDDHDDDHDDGGGSSTVSGNFAGFDGLGYGGGIYNDGTMTLSATTLSGNSAGHTGGGIYNVGTLIISSSTLSGNTSFYAGGGIANLGTLTVSGSTISDNSNRNLGSAGNVGGGIVNEGTLTLSGSTVSANSAYRGGGIFNSYGTLTIRDSTLFGNSATYVGGGIENFGTLTVRGTSVSGNSATYGGAIFNNLTATVSVRGSTLSGNTANYGGAIYNYQGIVTLSSSTVTGNSATTAGGGIYNISIGTQGSVTVTNFSTIWGNTAPVGFGADVFNDTTYGGSVLYLDVSSMIGILDGTPAVAI